MGSRHVQQKLVFSGEIIWQVGSLLTCQILYIPQISHLHFFSQYKIMANPANLTINEASANSSINQPAAQLVDTNGTINCPVKSLTDRLMLEVVNTDDAALTVTVKAGTGVQAHTARDLAVALTAAGGANPAKLIGPLESQRFVKADGSIDVQFQAAAGSPAASVRVYRLPANI